MQYKWPALLALVLLKLQTLQGPVLLPQTQVSLIKLTLAAEEDERYRYLLTNGIVRRVEEENKIIFAELPQIPGVLVVYRKPSERAANPERL